MSKEIKEIQDGNKLIAQFMGGVYDGKKYWEFPNGRILIHAPNYDSQFKYHTSWDWIMPVVGKIKDTLNNWPTRPSENHCCKGDLIEVDIQCALYEIKREMVWNAVVEFIKWYNIAINPLPNPIEK
jgi:hypothetical protein